MLGMSEDFYKGTYEAMFYSQGRATFATKILHRALERFLNKNRLNFPITLEIGGGEGLHFDYVKSGYTKYILTDIRESPLCPAASEAQKLGKLEFRVQDAENLTFQDAEVDRVIFACVLHHLLRPEIALREARRVVKNGGMISIYLPCDPGFLYRQMRKLFTRSRARKLGIDYELYNVRQHINHYYQLNKLIEHVFKDDKLLRSKFPVGFGTYDLNIFSVIHITKS
jgi:phosphatidylethanolamine/phosphatidyl-N-methylethanolamine N-methyltransferase